MINLIVSLWIGIFGAHKVAQVEPCVWPRTCSNIAIKDPCPVGVVCVNVAQVESCDWPKTCGTKSHGA